MEALAGLGALGALAGIFWLIGALVILSIAIDAGRLVRRANQVIEQLEQQNRHLAAISADLAGLINVIRDQRQGDSALKS
jgi:hypothetical protein